MDKDSEKAPNNISKIMNGIKSSIPNLKGLGDFMKISMPDMLTPPVVIDYDAIDKISKKKRQKDNIRFWLIIFLTIIGLFIMTFTYFKVK